MSFWDIFGGTRKANEKLALAISDNNVQLQELTQALNDREAPNKIREAILDGLQAGNIERSLTATSKHLDLLNSTLKDTGTRPLPVQTFPITDDFRFEEEKQKAATRIASLVHSINEEFIGKLKVAHQPVGQAVERLFSKIDDHRKHPEAQNGHLGKAMEELLSCSPKRVIASFQKHSLEAGWLIVSKFNTQIDLLAKEYPRCRAGISASRLNYSDVVQISEEILTTLRATSTLLEDVQRRHDMLDALKGELWSDLHNSEIQKIWDSIGSSFADTFGLAREDDPWCSKIFKGAVSVSATLPVFAMAMLSAPSAQFQGQLTRAQRVRVFVATAILLRVVGLNGQKPIKLSLSPIWKSCLP